MFANLNTFVCKESCRVLINEDWDLATEMRKNEKFKIENENNDCTLESTFIKVLGHGSPIFFLFFLSCNILKVTGPLKEIIATKSWKVFKWGLSLCPHPPLSPIVWYLWSRFVSQWNVRPLLRTHISPQELTIG